MVCTLAIIEARELKHSKGSKKSRSSSSSVVQLVIVPDWQTPPPFVPVETIAPRIVPVPAPVAVENLTTQSDAIAQNPVKNSSTVFFFILGAVFGVSAVAGVAGITYRRKNQACETDPDEIVIVDENWQRTESLDAYEGDSGEYPVDEIIARKRAKAASQKPYAELHDSIVYLPDSDSEYEFDDR